MPYPRGVDLQVALVDPTTGTALGSSSLPVDTELGAAVALSADALAFPTTAMTGAIALALDQGSSPYTYSPLRNHNALTDARANTIIGMVTQSRLYGHNHNTPGSGTSDLLRTVRAADGNAGLGVLGVGAMGWDGAAVRQIKAATDGTTLVGGFTTTIAATLTRPNDTTAYAAGDQVANSTSAPTILTFTNCARFSGGSGIITQAIIADSVVGASLATLELWLFDTTATPNNDNAAFAPTDGVTNTCVGVIALSTSYSATNNVLLDSGPVHIPFTCVGSANLFGMLVVRNAYTPAALEVFQVRLKVLQD